MTNANAIHAMLAGQIGPLWSEGRLELVEAMYAPDCIDHMPVPGQAGGHEGLKHAVRMFRAAMPDLTLTLTYTLARGTPADGWGVDVWSLTGTHTGADLFGLPASGRSVAMSGIDWVRVAGGRIVELWHVEDMAAMADQLGMAIPPVPLATAARPAEPLLPAGPLSAGEAAALAVARRHLEGMWRAGDPSVADEVYADDITDMNPAPGQPPGKAGIIAALHYLRRGAPDLELHIAAYLVDGPLVADRWVMTGTHTGAPLFGLPARGRPFRINGMDVVRVNAVGRIDRVWHVEDFFALRGQIAGHN